MSSGSTGLAGRYAGALYALAIDSSEVDSIHDELGRLFDLINESHDLRKMLDSPILSRDEQQRAITAVMEKAGGNALTVKFLGTQLQMAVEARPASFRLFSKSMPDSVDKSLLR